MWVKYISSIVRLKCVCVCDCLGMLLGIGCWILLSFIEVGVVAVKRRG